MDWGPGERIAKCRKRRTAGGATSRKTSRGGAWTHRRRSETPSTPGQKPAKKGRGRMNDHTENMATRSMPDDQPGKEKHVGADNNVFLGHAMVIINPPFFWKMKRKVKTEKGEI